MKQNSEERISSIIGNRYLASDIEKSISLALRSPFVHLVSGKTEWDIFNQSLNWAVRDIKKHPIGILFQRLIKYGPLNPDDPVTLVSDGNTTLSDPECGLCVDFIYSHMINRFKAELAELLSIAPCVSLVQLLQKEGQLPEDAHLYLGETIQDPIGRRKGADGLIVKQNPITRSKQMICGIIEVKSINLDKKRILDSINRQITRMAGGIKLESKMWSSNEISLDHHKIIRIMVKPSTWKLSRELYSLKTNKGRKLVIPDSSSSTIPTLVEELSPNLWMITLSGAVELIEQAAYEMTFWYMSQVGKHVFEDRSKLPKGWEYMTPEEAGYNAIKMMLYYIPLRSVSTRQKLLATKLYNAYSFGYSHAKDSSEMLWPEDLPYDTERVINNWRDFQNAVAELFRKKPGVRRVFEEHTISGAKGKVKVDVLVEFGTGLFIVDQEIVIRVIIECKFWKRRIPLEKIYTLKGVVQEVGAAMGILVTAVGVQSGVNEYLNHAGNLHAVTFGQLCSATKNMHVVVCSDCGKQFLIMFAQKGQQAVCQDCFRKKRRFLF